MDAAGSRLAVGTAAANLERYSPADRPSAGIPKPASDWAPCKSIVIATE